MRYDVVTRTQRLGLCPAFSRQDGARYFDAFADGEDFKTYDTKIIKEIDL
jgi:hypothetical protein